MRREHDFYPTPAWATKELLKRQPIAGKVLECCSGRDDIANELRRDPTRSVITNDLDETRPSTLHADATDLRWWANWRHLAWVVSNPAFNVAHRIVPPAFDAAEVGIAMLLRITYLEPCAGRAGWLAAHPPNDLIVLPRISFTGDGKTDSATCAWFVWRKHATGQTIEIVPDPSDLSGPMFQEPSEAA